MTGLCLFLICICCICVRAQILGEGDYLNDYPPASVYLSDSQQDTGYANYRKPEIIREQSGSDILLKCSTTSCLYIKQNSVWEFKRCEPDFKKSSCTNFDGLSVRGGPSKNITWNTVRGHVMRHKCSVNLHLHNVNTSYSGLYRCITDDKVIKTYEVIVVDRNDKSNYQPAELLDVIPANATIEINTRVIIQCRVYSQLSPTIWWFKESDATNYDIKFSGKYYLQINKSVSAYSVPHESNVYLSKLYIYHAKEVDSGKYVCFALTHNGTAQKDATINVVSTDKYWEPQRSFVLLFLIPIIFALIPVTIWLCYYRKKRKTIQKVTAQGYQNGCMVKLILSQRIVALTNHSTTV